MKTPENVRQLTAELGNSAWVHSVLCGAVESGLLQGLDRPRTGCDSSLPDPDDDSGDLLEVDGGVEELLARELREVDDRVPRAQRHERGS